MSFKFHNQARLMVFSLILFWGSSLICCQSEERRQLAIVNLAVTENPNNVLSRIVTFETTLPSYVSAMVLMNGQPVQNVGPTNIMATSHKIWVLALLPEKEYTVKVSAETENGSETASFETQTFRTASLPEGMPKFSVKVTNPEKMQPGYTAFSYQLKTDYTPSMENTLGTLVVLDQGGEVTWYRESLQDTSGGGIFFLLEDATIFFLFDGWSKLKEINWIGEVVNEWSVEDFGVADGYFSHDSTLLPNGNILLLVKDRTGENPDGTPIMSDFAYEVTRDFHFVNSWELSGYTSQDTEWYANAIDYRSSDDSMIIHLYSQSSRFIKIRRSTGELVWTLGGPDSDFTFEGDGYFPDKMHGPDWLADDDFLVLDNGTLTLPDIEKPARAVEFSLDFNDAGMYSVTQVWEYIDDIPSVTEGAGNVTRLDNGNNLVCEGTRISLSPIPHVNPRIIEVTGGSPFEIVFMLEIEAEIVDGSLQKMYPIYRAWHLDDFKSIIQN